MSFDLSRTSLTRERLTAMLDILDDARMYQPTVMYMNAATYERMMEAHRWRKTPAGRYYFRVQARRPSRHARARRRF